MHMKWIMWLGETITHGHRRRDVQTCVCGVYIYVTECEKESREEKRKRRRRRRRRPPNGADVHDNNSNWDWLMIMWQEVRRNETKQRWVEKYLLRTVPMKMGEEYPMTNAHVDSSPATKKLHLHLIRWLILFISSMSFVYVHLPEDNGVTIVRGGIAAPGRERDNGPLSEFNRDFAVDVDGLGRAKNRAPSWIGEKSDSNKEHLPCEKRRILRGLLAKNIMSLVGTICERTMFFLLRRFSSSSSSLVLRSCVDTEFKYQWKLNRHVYITTALLLMVASGC